MTNAPDFPALIIVPSRTRKGKNHPAHEVTFEKYTEEL